MNNLKSRNSFFSFFSSLLLSSFIVLLAGSVIAAPTRFTSPNYGVESVIFGGTGVLRTGESVSIPPTITQAPAVSDVTTSGATITWKTNKNSNSVVLIGTASNNYTLQLGQVTEAIYTTHIVTIQQLEKATKYFFKVSSADAFGNTVQSGESSFTADPGDITAPTLKSGPIISNASATSLIISWETNEIASTTVEYGTDLVTEKVNSKPDELTTFHQIEINGLIPSQTYLVRVKSRDVAGNLYTGQILTVTTPQATSITDVKVSDITLNSALIQWRTTAASTSLVSYGVNQVYDQEINDNAYSETHSIRLTGLQNGSIYSFKIKGVDQGGNFLASDEYVFRTVVLPQISEFAFKEVTSNSAILTWISSADIDELVRYDIIKNANVELVGKKFVGGNDKSVSVHTYKLSDLESGSEYSVQVLGKDIFGNQAISSTLTFTTKEDSAPPLIENIKSDTSVDLGSKQSVQVLVSFGLSEPGTAMIEYGVGASGDYESKVTTDTEFSQGKFMVIPSLTPGQSYHFRIVAKDRAGNTATTADYLVLAPSKPVSLLDLIFGQVRDNFGWLGRLGK